jgi:hypothetical protein
MATATKVRFYELNEQRAILDEFLRETEGEETPEIAALWEQLQGDADNKAANWAKWNKELALQGKQIEGMEAVLKKECERLATERKAIEARVEKSRAELSRQMLQFGVEKVKAAGISIWHVDEKPEIVVGAIDLPDLYAAGSPIVTYTPPATVPVPERYEINTDAVIALAKAHAAFAALDADVREGVPSDQVPEPLPAGVTVTFRKGIRIR